MDGDTLTIGDPRPSIAHGQCIGYQQGDDFVLTAIEQTQVATVRRFVCRRAPDGRGHGAGSGGCHPGYRSIRIAGPRRNAGGPRVPGPSRPPLLPDRTVALGHWSRAGHLDRGRARPAHPLRGFVPGRVTDEQRVDLVRADNTKGSATRLNLPRPPLHG